LGDTRAKTLAHRTRRGKPGLQSGGVPGSARVHRLAESIREILVVKKR